jgi:ABC-type transporter MlaC component
MRRDHLLPWLAIAALVASPAAAIAAADPAVVVSSFHASVVAAAHDAKAGRPAAERAIRHSFDLDALVNSILGDRAESASAAQRARLADLIVRRLAERVLKDPDIRAAAPLTVVKTRPISDSVWLVSTRTAGQEVNTSLTWRLRDGTAGPRIVDVLHDGVSMASTERRRLETALKGRDLDAALAEVEKEGDKKGR